MFEVISRHDGFIYTVYNIKGDNESGVLFLIYKDGIGFSYEYQSEFVPVRRSNT